MKVEVKLTPTLIILSNYRGPCKYMINLLLVIMKQFIYSSKCFEEIPVFTKFMSKLSYWYHVEKIHAQQTNNIAPLIRKWKGIF